MTAVGGADADGTEKEAESGEEKAGGELSSPALAKATRKRAVAPKKPAAIAGLRFQDIFLAT